jgi:hypothetical protein
MPLRRFLSILAAQTILPYAAGLGTWRGMAGK